MIKVKLKNLIFGAILLLLTFVLTGCANVDYSRFINSAGEITDRLVIELDANKIRETNVKPSLVAERIMEDLDTLYIQPVRNFKDNYSHEAHTDEQKRLVREGITYGLQMVGDSNVVAEINFSSVAMFNLYYGVEENADEEEELEFREGTFVNRYVQSSQNAFAVLKTQKLKQLIKRYEAMFANEFSLENDVKLTQVYASPNTDIKSNANTTEISQGIKMHQWEIDSNNLDFNLEFYTLSAKTGPWYILALFVTFLVVFVLYCNIRSKKFKEQKNVNQTNIDQNKN